MSQMHRIIFSLQNSEKCKVFPQKIFRIDFLFLFFGVADFSILVIRNLSYRAGDYSSGLGRGASTPKVWAHISRNSDSSPNLMTFSLVNIFSASFAKKRISKENLEKVFFFQISKLFLKSRKFRRHFRDFKKNSDT